MKVQVVTQVTINAAQGDVFGYLKDLNRHYLWNPGLQNISPLAELKQGMSYTTARYILGKRLTATNMVTKFTDDRELELENTTGMIHYKVCYRLSPKNDKTVVSCQTNVFSTSSAFAFAKPVLEVLARRELQSDLQSLKVAVEQKLK